MPDDFHIEARRASTADFDDLVYSEGAERTLTLGCRATQTPVPVWVPDGNAWTERTPPWAHSRRDVVVERLRAWGAMVYEWRMDGWNTVTTILAPDASFRVETVMEPDDRAPAWERTRIIASAGDEVLADLPLHATEGPIVFPRAGAVVLNLRGHYDDRHRLHVDVARRTFALEGDADPSEQPLDRLHARMNPPYPAPRPYSSKTAVPAVAAATARAPAGRGARWLAYAPMIALGVEAAWLVVLLGAFLFLVGDSRYVHTPGSAGVRFVAALSTLPALAGLFAGALCVRRGGAQSAVDRTFLVLGCVGCAACALSFGAEAFG